MGMIQKTNDYRVVRGKNTETFLCEYKELNIVYCESYPKAVMPRMSSFAFLYSE